MGNTHHWFDFDKKWFEIKQPTNQERILSFKNNPSDYENLVNNSAKAKKLPGAALVVADLKNNLNK